MRPSKHYRYAFYVAAAIALASLLANALVARALFTYQDNHPEGSSPVTGRCAAPALVGHWTFDELRGEVAPDASAHANHARLHVQERPFARLRHGLPEHVTGARGNALQLQGRQWVSAGNNDCFTREQFTFAGWVWRDDPGSAPTIVSKAAWTHNGWWLMTTSMEAQGTEGFLDLGISWGSGRQHVESGYRLPLREWHHVVVTADNTRGEVRFFIDGAPARHHTNVPKWLVNWDHDLILGDFDGSTRWPWIGKLDDVRFYNYAISDADALNLYRSSAPTLVQ